MVQTQSLRLIAAVMLLATLSSANVTRAAFVPVASGTNLPDADGTTADFNNAKYKVAYGNGSVTYDAGDVGSQQGTIKITAAFTECNEYKFTFTQTALPTDDPANPPSPFSSTGGLRIQLQLMITNNTGKEWCGFTVKTDDMSVPANLDPSVAGSSGSHDHHAHFHPNGPNPPGPPAVTGMPMPGSTGFTTPTNDDINNATMFMIGGTQSDSGNGFGMTGLFLHERNLKKAAAPPDPAMAVLRTFDLILTPKCCVPEPSSLLLLMLGCVTVGTGRRRR